MTNAIVQQATSNGALNASHYQTFEMAKANDGILGGDDVAQIRSYAAFARAQAQAIHKSIATMGELEDVAQAKAEMTETSQTFAKVSVYADQRIGEILRELPKAKGNQYTSADCDAPQKPTKSEAIRDAGIDTRTAYDLQAMAANPKVVEAVIAKAEQDGRVVSRSQVLKEIDERKHAERELRKASIAQTNLEMEAESLRQQLAAKPEPQVIEREVEVVREVVPQDVQRRIESLEYYKNLGDEDNRKLRKQNEELRKKLDRAKVLLEEKGYEDNASWDISMLTTATNTYLSRYGGKVWAFEQFYRVDEVTQQEFVKAMKNLAAFAQNTVQYISDTNKLEA